MTLEKLRTRAGDDCLSDLQLDALELGALEASRAEQARRHLAECGRCSARQRELGAETRASAEVLASQPRRVGAAPRGSKTAQRRSSPRAWAGGVAAALAAAAALLLVVGRLSPPTGEDGVRSKGTSRVGFFVRHAGVVRRGSERERVVPGDALRFVVTSSVPSYVAVLSRDGAGQASIYHPSGVRAARVEPGVERPLDASVVLDDVLGEERLFALACSAPVELEPLLEALRSSAADPSWPAQCSIERFVLVKEAGP